MAEAIRWTPKKDRDGKVIPTCWLTDAGYTVAECRVPEKRLTVMRPGGDKPFAYCSSRDEVLAAIELDMQLQADA